MDNFKDCILDLSSPETKFNVKKINIIRENNSRCSYDADASMVFATKKGETHGCVSENNSDLLACCIAAIKTMKKAKVNDDLSMFDAAFLYCELEGKKNE